MQADIFISYRRDDSAGYAGRLYDCLNSHFGAGRTFMDVDGIEAGKDFVQALDDNVGKCNALVAVIGPKWLTIAGADGTRRLSDPQDFVRLEIATALRRNIPIFPVLMGGAIMPCTHELPDDLKALASRQALVIEDVYFHEQANHLTKVLDEVVPHQRMESARKSAWMLVLAFAILAALLLTWRISSRTAAVRVEVAGNWQAQVKYDWGDSYVEHFNFSVDTHELSGTASYVTGNHAIIDGKLDGTRITFMTKSHSTVNDKDYEEKHSYKGLLTGDEIHFTLLTDSGYDDSLPVTFIAKRVAPTNKE